MFKNTGLGCWYDSVSDRKIHITNDKNNFVIYEKDTWLLGSYESIDAAKVAFELDDEILLYSILLK